MRKIVLLLIACSIVSISSDVFAAKKAPPSPNIQLQITNPQRNARFHRGDTMNISINANVQSLKYADRIEIALLDSGGAHTITSTSITNLSFPLTTTLQIPADAPIGNCRLRAEAISSSYNLTRNVATTALRVIINANLSITSPAPIAPAPRAVFRPGDSFNVTVNANSDAAAAAGLLLVELTRADRRSPVASAILRSPLGSPPFTSTLQIPAGTVPNIYGLSAILQPPDAFENESQTLQVEVRKLVSTDLRFTAPVETTLYPGSVEVGLTMSPQASQNAQQLDIGYRESGIEFFGSTVHILNPGPSVRTSIHIDEGNRAGGQYELFASLVPKPFIDFTDSTATRPITVTEPIPFYSLVSPHIIGSAYHIVTQGQAVEISAIVRNSGIEGRDEIVEIKDLNNNTLCQSNPITIPAGPGGSLDVHIPYTFNQPPGTLRIKSKIRNFESQPTVITLQTAFVLAAPSVSGDLINRGVQTTIVATVNNNGAERRDIVVEIKDQNNNTLCQSNPVTVPAGAAGTTVNIPYTFNQPAGTSLTLKSKIGALESPPSAAYTVR